MPPEINIECRLTDSAALPALGLAEGPYYEITFSDNGIGFSPRYSEQVFEIFQRLHSKEHYAGTGIGLALSKRVVENHHGRIIADPEEGRGATFRIYLPA